MPSRAYFLSLPERVIRSALGFSAGLLREIGELALPRTVRRGQLYKSLVDTTLRYVIEQVGGAKGVYPAGVPQAQDFLARRGDRKSTRLNSSHQIISYAVFCLNKKTTKRHQRRNSSTPRRLRRH